MKQFIYMLLFFAFGCTNPEQVKKEVDKEQNIEELEFVEDTILERNNPMALDLTKHQLFIDTTRSSKFYENLINWKPHEYHIGTIKAYIGGLNEMSKYEKVSFKKFPRIFVKINKLVDKFYLYDRCDGIDQRYELRDSAFVSYGPMESDAETIRRVYKVSSEGVKIELNSFKAKTRSGFSTLEIVKTEYDGIYSIKYHNDNYHIEAFAIPRSDILKYDLVVNHCPVIKMREYRPFY